MENPPKQFLASSDALTVVTSVIEAHLQEMRTYEDLSCVKGAINKAWTATFDDLFTKATAFNPSK